MKDFFELGRILKPQGVRGELKAELYTDDINRVYDLPYVLVGTPPDLTRFDVESARSDGRFVYLNLKGVSGRDAAEAMRDTVLYIDRAHAAPLPEGAFYISDLEGMDVTTEDGTRLGTLKTVLQHGAADVYVVEREDHTEFMFPAVEDVFVERDVNRGQIVLDARRLQEIADL